MPRFSEEIFITTLTMTTALLSPEIAFWVQLYFLSKDSHGDVDIFVHKMHRDAIRSHFESGPTFKRCPDGDQHRDRMTIDIVGKEVVVEWKYSTHPEASAFAGSYGGIFHILLLPSIRGMYGQHVSINDGHVVFKQGNVVVPIMTLHQFLKQHNFDLHVSQDHAFPTINDFFNAWSVSTCFCSSAVVHTFQKTKKRDERVLGMYDAFTAWLTSNGFSVEKLLEKPVLTPEQCQQKAEETFPEACLRFQQALDAEKEAIERTKDIKKVISAKSILLIIAPGDTDQSRMPIFASVSNFLKGTPNENDIAHVNYVKCNALHNQFKAIHGGGDIYTAIMKTLNTEQFLQYVKDMWIVYNSTPTTTQEEEN
jgi:hypothetical protein